MSSHVIVLLKYTSNHRALLCLYISQAKALTRFVLYFLFKMFIEQTSLEERNRVSLQRKEKPCLFSNMINVMSLSLVKARQAYYLFRDLGSLNLGCLSYDATHLTLQILRPKEPAQMLITIAVSNTVLYL